jgi:hypothetical protein
VSADGWKHMRPDQPRTCAGCGERVTLKGEAIWLKTSDPPQSWHFRCRPRSLNREAR